MGQRLKEQVAELQRKLGESASRHEDAELASRDAAKHANEVRVRAKLGEASASDVRDAEKAAERAAPLTEKWAADAESI